MPVESPAPLIDLRALHVAFGPHPVLRDFSLQVPAGQTLVLIGESGCGKSVLLKTIIGLVRPDLGEVWFDAQKLSQLNERELARQRTRFGFVFQQAALFDSLTVGQNISFPLRQNGMTDRREIERIVRARLADVGLSDSVAIKKPAELSGGMRKRVGLARALAMEPEVMMYDEPTTGLDPIMSDVINELILRTRQRRPVTSLVVTHDMHTARKVADRIVMLYPLSRLQGSESQIVFDGSPAEIESCNDARVLQFVRGEAGERLMEMNFEGHVHA